MTKKIISALFLTIGAFFYQVDAQVSNLGVEVHPDNVSNTGTVTGIYANSFFMWTPALGLKNIGDVPTGFLLPVQEVFPRTEVRLLCL